MLHDGQIDESESLLYSQTILSLTRIVTEWQTWTSLVNEGHFIFDGQSVKSDLDPGVKNDWWNPKWIPTHC